MTYSSRNQTLMRRLRVGARFAKLAVLSIFLPTKVLTDMAERR
jgi:hypothetical protein